MKVKKLTSEQIVRIYQLREQKPRKTWAYIATATQAKESTAFKAHEAMVKYLAQGLSSYTLPTYVEAYRQLQKASIPWSTEADVAGSVGTGLTPPPQQSVDRFTKIEQAFNAFQQAIVDFVENEATKRAEEKVAEKEQELQAMTEKIEKLATALDEAKQSNVVGFLRKKFGNP